MRTKRKYIILLALTLFLIFTFQFIPISTRAVEFEGGIIPATCRTGCPCTLCDLYQLSLNIIDFLLYGISLPIAAVMLAWGGLKMLTSAGNPTAITEGKKILTNAVIGIILAFLAWLIINALLITLGFGFDAWPSVKWNERPTCQPAGGSCTPDVAGEPGQQQGAGGDGGGRPPECNNPQQLAQQNNEPYPEKTSDTTRILLSCIQGRVSFPLGEISTYDRSHRICNFTRGQQICGSCSHSRNSCHYGGAAGNNGAEAIDFGLGHNEVQYGDLLIRAANDCGAKAARCENSSGGTVNCLSGNATHVHVTSSGCDRS